MNNGLERHWQRIAAVRHGEGYRLVLLCAYLALVALAVALVAASSAQARTDNASKPVLAVHGYGQFEPLQIGVPCPEQWWTMKTILWWQGFRDIDGVGYYATDVGCEVDLLAKDLSRLGGGNGHEVGLFERDEAAGQL